MGRSQTPPNRTWGEGNLTWLQGTGAPPDHFDCRLRQFPAKLGMTPGVFPNLLSRGWAPLLSFCHAHG